MEQTERVQSFLKEIGEVCRKHGLVITVSGYDDLHVWPLEEDSLRYLLSSKDHAQE